MRLFVSVDIEGIGAVVSDAQADENGFEYADARRWMTNEVLAAVEAAHRSGVRDIVVADGHGNGQNILPDLMPDYVDLVRGWPRPLGMMQGIEHGRFDAAFLIGYHAGAMSRGGVMNHTLGGFLTDISVNGTSMDETMLAAAVAGHFDVPVVLVSGDDVTTASAAERLGDVEPVTIKRAYGRASAIGRSPAMVSRMIAEAVPAALRRIASARPYRIEGPLEIMLTLRTTLQAELLDYLPFVERIDSRCVTFRLADIPALAATMEFLDQYDRSKF